MDSRYESEDVGVESDSVYGSECGERVWREGVRVGVSIKVRGWEWRE